jgi:hypothetical protein
MKVRELRLVLEALAAMSISLGAKASEAEDLKRFAKQLAEFDRLSLDELTSRLESDDASSRKPESVDPSHLVAGYVSRLQECRTDRLKYLSVVSELQADKKIRIAEMNELVSLVTMVPNKFKNKKAAIEALEAWQQRKQDTERRLGSTEELF